MKRFIATIKWNSGNSRTTVEVWADNQVEARKVARQVAGFNTHGQVPENATVTFQK